VPGPGPGTEAVRGKASRTARPVARRNRLSAIAISRPGPYNGEGRAGTSAPGIVGRILVAAGPDGPPVDLVAEREEDGQCTSGAPDRLRSRRPCPFEGRGQRRAGETGQPRPVADAVPAHEPPPPAQGRAEASGTSVVDAIEEPAQRRPPGLRSSEASAKSSSQVSPTPTRDLLRKSRGSRGQHVVSSPFNRPRADRNPCTMRPSFRHYRESHRRRSHKPKRSRRAGGRRGEPG
jgi:hypothetical protein